jgi:poly-gamma-glutamate synthesis protein (capsule biosynthesis protein)
MGRKWKYPLPCFEENPLYFSFADIAYFSYKYYHTQIRTPEKNSVVDEYFHGQIFERIADSSHITVSLGGDLMPYATITKETCAQLWDHVGEYFFTADIVFANLETPIDLSKEPGFVPEVMLNDMMFNGSEEMFEIFNGNGKHKGFQVLSVANNHSLDQQASGLTQTLRFLRERNIAFCGAAATKEELHDFPILERNGISVAFIAFTFSLNKCDLPSGEEWRVNHIRLNSQHPDISLIAEQASIARTRGADVVITSLHMGNAYQAYPSEHIRENMYRICREAGVDVIVGGHPHNPQPIEWYNYMKDGLQKKTLIFYSLGDLVAYDIYSWAHLALLPKLSIEKSKGKAMVTGFELLPAYALGESGGKGINKISFNHLDAVYPNRYRYSPRIQRDISSTFDLYTTLLFTSKQREQIIFRQ